MPKIPKRKRKKSKTSPSLSKGWTWTLLLLLAGGFGWYLYWPAGSEGQVPTTVTPAQVAKGETLFAQHCAACHGPEARGQVAAQPMGGVSDNGTYIAPALNGRGHAWHHPPEMLFDVIRNGSPAADSPMKGFQGRLHDRDIQAVLGYVFSLWPESLRLRYERMMKGR